MRNILKLLKFSILFQMRRRKSDIFEKTEIWIRTTYINTSFDRKFYADFKFSCHKFRRPRILKKTSLGEVSLYQDNSPLKYSQYHSSSWYKDTSTMPEYRYGTTCSLGVGVVGKGGWKVLCWKKLSNITIVYVKTRIWKGLCTFRSFQLSFQTTCTRIHKRAWDSRN